MQFHPFFSFPFVLPSSEQHNGDHAVVYLLVVACLPKQHVCYNMTRWHCQPVDVVVLPSMDMESQMALSSPSETLV